MEISPFERGLTGSTPAKPLRTRGAGHSRPEFTTNLLPAVAARIGVLAAMITNEYNTHSAEETVQLGRELAHVLGGARMVVLTGDLGAGKTTLVKGIAEGFEAASQDDVTSPTFTLIHEYRALSMNLFHVDLYRIERPRELVTLGLDELFAEQGNLVLLEWGEKFARFVKECDTQIVIERTGVSERKIIVTTK